MPQMAPIWWSSLMIMFLMTYMIFLISMYFLKSYKISLMTKSSKKTKNINWKW